MKRYCQLCGAIRCLEEECSGWDNYEICSPEFDKCGSMKLQFILIDGSITAFLICRKCHKKYRKYNLKRIEDLPIKITKALVLKRLERKK